ncbi:alcohol dehydrogenase [Mycolicibacterium insubricum]|uniref:NADPH:quinone oxidoreductase n=1 Tax=Mycolicibacterium insubricum TaxID=444597 RepID=A0A1X0DG02_9MYCO|nr:NADPH:quinone oxidoreductase family protein [Mycolicibacterium insubricum]MCV7080160.1 NADPH:quinone oxidoreductase family protein [Mycolicibacterium insubricum]ORA71305.1 NADPH:quinone oxidoreductase [Mycolicibacterium insubricum]BBZ68088.1 alcohol dehydrogenase [Mycolicibacterium insubricum]
MRAIRCLEFGPPEDLVLTEVAEPEPGPGQLLVRVAAAAVNFPDVLFLSGGYQVAVPPPFTPGSEFAGEVTALGAGVTEYRPGDRVSGSLLVGAFAEYVVIDARAVTRVPEGIGLDAAAAFGVTYRTAYFALRSVAEVKAKDTVVVLGAAGGVGLAAVDLAVAMGARVIAAAASAEKLALCSRRGAHTVVDYDRQNLRDAIKAATDGRGADVVLDPVGGHYSEPALRALGRGGVFVTLGYASGQIPSIPLNLVLLKGITVRGMEIRTFFTDHPEAALRDTAELHEMFAAGRVGPYIGARFPLAEAGAAIRLVADRRALGKVLIEMR